MPDDNDWQKIWDERKAGIESILGPSEDRVFTSAIPIYLGGNADVMMFRKHVNGITYCSAGASETGDGWNIEDRQFEFVIACDQEEDWAINIVSFLGKYSLGNRIQPNETMDASSAYPDESSVAAILFVEYGSFVLGEGEAGLLLCLGITQAELEFSRFLGSTNDLVRLLKEANIFPKTQPFRKSVV